ncbi:MAG: helix-turn-helix domain-containing protein [Steroidobacteraceae bacterium]
MRKSTDLTEVLQALALRARAAGLTDTAWAARAGVRKETLSRLRTRDTCDFATLSALADAVECRLGVLDSAASEAATAGHFPRRLNREYEEKLLQLCASRTLDVAHWQELGPSFFMAGLAVMLAGDRKFDRRGLLDLAEQLHPGATEPEVFARWLEHSPVRPSRFLPLLDALVGRAA